jgi:hypothetical protein
VLGLLGWRTLVIPAEYFRFAFFLIERAIMGDRVGCPPSAPRPTSGGEALAQRRTPAPPYGWCSSAWGDKHSHLASPETVRAHRAGAFATPLTIIWPERVVVLVSPGGPADTAGVRVGDFVGVVDGSGCLVFSPGCAHTPCRRLTPFPRTAEAHPGSTRTSPRFASSAPPLVVRNERIP